MRASLIGKIFSYLRTGCLHTSTGIVGKDDKLRLKCRNCGAESRGIEIKDQVTHKLERLSQGT